MKRNLFVPVMTAIFLCFFFRMEARATDLFSGLEPTKNNMHSLESEKAARDLRADDHVENISKYWRLYYEKEPIVIADVAIERYLNGLKDRLLAKAPAYARQFEYQVRLFLSEEFIAQAVPGGTIFISLGALKDAASEDYLASILAHEIGHIALRHDTAHDTYEAMLGKEYALIDSELEKKSEKISEQDIQRRQMLEFMKRDCADRMDMRAAKFVAAIETEADIFGVRLMMAAGLDPLAFMRQMADEEKTKKPFVWWRESMHLPSSVRLAMMQYEMSVWIKEYSVVQASSPDEFLRIRKKANDLLLKK